MRRRAVAGGGARGRAARRACRGPARAAPARAAAGGAPQRRQGACPGRAPARVVGGRAGRARRGGRGCAARPCHGRLRVLGHRGGPRRRRRERPRAAAGGRAGGRRRLARQDGGLRRAGRRAAAAGRGRARGAPGARGPPARRAAGAPGCEILNLPTRPCPVLEHLGAAAAGVHDCQARCAVAGRPRAAGGRGKQAGRRRGPQGLHVFAGGLAGLARAACQGAHALGRQATRTSAWRAPRWRRSRPRCAPAGACSSRTSTASCRRSSCAQPTTRRDPAYSASCSAWPLCARSLPRAPDRQAAEPDPQLRPAGSVVPVCSSALSLHLLSGSG